MKKFLTSIFAFALIITSLFALTACGAKEEFSDYNLKTINFMVGGQEMSLDYVNKDTLPDDQKAACQSVKLAYGDLIKMSDKKIRLTGATFTAVNSGETTYTKAENNIIISSELLKTYFSKFELSGDELTVTVNTGMDSVAAYTLVFKKA